MTALASLLVGLGVFLAVVAVRQRSGRRVRDLRKVLELSYVDTGAVDGDELRVALARTGRLAERALGRTSTFSRVGATLARSDWTLSTGEFLAVSAATGGAGLLVGALAGSAGFGLLLLVTGVALPYVLVARSVRRRRAAFEDQLPDVLDLLAASLEAGAGLAAALELVVAEADDPSAGEFARVLTATRLGVPLVEGLAQMAARLDSRDLSYTVQAVAVQERTGGRLVEVLTIVAEFVRGRAELRREIRGLTAEGRLSAYILVGLPFAIAALVSLTNPAYLEPLYTTVYGVVMLLGSALLLVVSGFLMRRIIQIEV